MVGSKKNGYITKELLRLFLQISPLHQFLCLTQGKIYDAKSSNAKKNGKVICF